MELLNTLSMNSKVVHCTFNISHTMPLKTLGLHLIKCPDRPKHYKNCFFNNLHVVPESELEEHQENCPNKYLLDEYFFQSEDVVRPNIPITAEPPPRGDEEESWDNLEENKIDVIKEINQTPNFMKPVFGLTKAQRKKYRKQAHQNVDLSFNQHVTVNERLTRETSDGGSKPFMKNKKNLEN
ncbi:TRM13/UPF0224 family, U11-48K-like CHHC zinc finger domain [Cinara cedri]|uniref:TRM13/UPF0224 family, U11-48K-like CHHC zinc finger domain n=1 Tax=Cinara cedri TaxID=506608 RepID=A0A5E4M1I5_9HEMI|nr:TRM13/UPF0224 family, U11-48K-like CHHC zinc finger domain [Cinara cedri]